MLSPKIRDLNLESIAFKVALDERWPLHEVDEAEFLYRCYLQAKLKYPKSALAPSRVIDIFWHHHILDTRKYTRDCKEIFGRYLHHFPYAGVRGTEDRIAQERRFAISMKIVQDIANGERDGKR
jgi:hypothetical protein